MAGQERVRQEVRALMSERGWNVSDLAREAGIDPGTAGDFVAGTRWPKPRTQGRIEQALGWPHGTIARIENGGDPPAVGAPTQDDSRVLLDLPPEALEGLSPAERDEAITAARLAILEKAREIRRRD